MEGKDRKRILVLEDREEMRRFIVSALTEKGHEVHLPVDNYVALGMIRSQAFDLVTVDLNMPLLDGASFIQAVQEMGVRVPVVVITGYPNDPRVEALRRMGVRHFLSKPFRLEELFKAIQEVTEGAPSS